jgi:hypothetical protein
MGEELLCLSRAVLLGDPRFDAAGLELLGGTLAVEGTGLGRRTLAAAAALHEELLDGDRALLVASTRGNALFLDLRGRGAAALGAGGRRRRLVTGCDAALDKRIRMLSASPDRLFPALLGIVPCLDAGPDLLLEARKTPANPILLS